MKESLPRLHIATHTICKCICPAYVSRVIRYRQTGVSIDGYSRPLRRCLRRVDDQTRYHIHRLSNSSNPPQEKRSIPQVSACMRKATNIDHFRSSAVSNHDPELAVL